MACYVIILNYNGWKDTVECLDSVFQSISKEKIKVIVCDNNSKDNSLDNIKKWADGRMGVDDVIRRPLKSKHANKIPCYEFFDCPVEGEINSDFILMDNKGNTGFAAGNNWGIRLAVKQKDCKYLFILNNDTVIEKDTIQKGIDKLDEDKRNGLCSTNVRYYHDPMKKGWVRKRYSSWLGCERSVGEVVREKWIVKYSGMSFFVTKEFIDKIGLMEEKYFLYFEEYDWACRSIGKFNHVIAEDSIVYHKEGGSLKYVSPFSQFCMMRSHFLFQKKFFPNKIIVVYAGWIVRLIRMIVRGDFSIGKQIFLFLINFPTHGENYFYKYRRIFNG